MKYGIRKAELFILPVLAACLLLQPQASARGTFEGLHTCATAIIPALFPFIALTDYWIRAGYAASLASFAAPVLNRLFHLPGTAAPALILGSIGGYPIGAKTVAQLYSQELLTADEAEHCLLFCNNAGPAFVLGVLGNGVFQSTTIGIVLYFIHLTAAFLMGILFRPKKVPQVTKQPLKPVMVASASQNWAKAISSAGKTGLQICCFVIFFSILSQCTLGLLPQSIRNSPFLSLLMGTLELAGGAKILAAGSWPQEIRFILSALLLGWGGFCVMLQSISALEEAGLSGKNLLLGKVCHSLSSALLAAIPALFLPLSIPCCGNPLSGLLPVFEQNTLLLLLIVLFGIFLKKSSGNRSTNQI